MSLTVFVQSPHYVSCALRHRLFCVVFIASRDVSIVFNLCTSSALAGTYINLAFHQCIYLFYFCVESVNSQHVIYELLQMNLLLIEIVTQCQERYIKMK